MRRAISILTSLSLLYAGILVFSRGFFASTPGLVGFSTEAPATKPQFSRLAFIVVDAMRSDFLFSSESNFSFAQSLINNGSAYPLTAHSSPPTVTLPRLKGLTSGAAPSFLDAVLNIAESDSSDLKFDSWIYQAKHASKEMCLFGDDTWLKLFPSVFDKQDGTSSFFVSDYTEVDNNVTRHLDRELSNWTCDVLVLHYLGLDHIGHKSGPHNSLMPPKQKEMDEVLRRVYEASDDQTLIVFAGDHGMNEVGNHGGSTIGETSAALLFASKKFKFTGFESPVEASTPFQFYERVQQTDIVPSISYLFGLPVPQNSIGLPILRLWPEAQRPTIIKDACKHFQSRFAYDGHCDEESMRVFQLKRSLSSETYSLFTMGCGLAILGFCLLTLSFIFKPLHLTRGELILWLATTALYAAAMFGSSTIEEEHQWWFWGFYALIIYVYAHCNSRTWGNMLVLLSAVRILRLWSRPGQKWLEHGDITTILSQHPSLLFLLIFATYGKYFLNHRRSPSDLIAGIASLAHRVTWLCHSGEDVTPLIKTLALPESSLPALARYVFVAASLSFLVSLKAQKLSLGWVTVLIMTQSKSTNVPLLLVYECIEVNLKALFKSARMEQSALVLLSKLYLQYMSFFASGGSNSLATIDLSMAYNGLSSYNIPLVGVLTFLSNWAGPVYWSFAVASNPTHMPLLIFFYVCSALALCSACYVLRTHLFIWTVFSPKILYCAAWGLLQLGIVDQLIVPLLACIVN